LTNAQKHDAHQELYATTNIRPSLSGRRLGTPMT
jgi:hypothetical protein